MSVSSNIAEGYGRKQPNDKEHFYVMAAGSLSEVQSQLEFAKGLKYLSEKDCDLLIADAVSCARQLSALLRTHRS